MKDRSNQLLVTFGFEIRKSFESGEASTRILVVDQTFAKCCLLLGMYFTVILFKGVALAPSLLPFINGSTPAGSI